MKHRIATIRPGFQKAQRSSPPFQNHPAKQKMREQTAMAFARILQGVQRPAIFVMPYYTALDAIAINNYIPDAEFWGVDRFRQIGENVDPVAPGKFVRMETMELLDYVRKKKGMLKFDAAFLDFFSKVNERRLKEILKFATGLMRKRVALAVTLQGDSVDELNTQLTNLLRDHGVQASLEFGETYHTKHDMVHLIFSLNRAENPVL